MSIKEKGRKLAWQFCLPYLPLPSAKEHLLRQGDRMEGGEGLFLPPCNSRHLFGDSERGGLPVLAYTLPDLLHGSGGKHAFPSSSPPPLPASPSLCY